MKRTISFFEIPTLDFRRAVQFYETILRIKMSITECEPEKMACFPKEGGFAPGAVIWAEGYSPAIKGTGVHISLNVDDIEKTLALIESNGGKMICPKAKIHAEGRGYFAVFNDTEGNQIGLYSDQ